MFEKILEVGAAFDWISPMASLLDELLFGPNYTFCIAVCSLTGREITSVLRKRKVNVGTTMIVDDTIMIDVRMKDAVKAQIILNRLGIPVLNPLPRKRRRRK